MSVSFLTSDVRWNLRQSPSTLPRKILKTVALPSNLVQRAKSTIYVPVFNACEEVCIVPDRLDGAITYKRLFHALYEYYDETMDTSTHIKRIDGVGEFVGYGGFIAYDLLDDGYKLTLNLFAL